MYIFRHAIDRDPPGPADWIAAGIPVPEAFLGKEGADVAEYLVADMDRKKPPHSEDEFSEPVEIWISNRGFIVRYVVQRLQRVVYHAHVQAWQI